MEWAKANEGPADPDRRPPAVPRDEPATTAELKEVGYLPIRRWRAPVAVDLAFRFLPLPADGVLFGAKLDEQAA